MCGGGWLSFTAFDKMDFVRKQWRPNGAACSQPRATPWVFNSGHIIPPRRGKSLMINCLCTLKKSLLLGKNSSKLVFALA